MSLRVIFDHLFYLYFFSPRTTLSLPYLLEGKGVRVRGKGKKTRCFLQYHTWVPCQCSGNWDDFLALFFRFFIFFWHCCSSPIQLFHNFHWDGIAFLFFFSFYFFFFALILFFLIFYFSFPFPLFFLFYFLIFPLHFFDFFFLSLPFFFCFLIYYIPDFPFSDLFLSASFPVSFHGCLRSTIVPSCLPSPPHSFPSSIPIHFETFLVSTCLWKFIALRFSHGPGGFT